MMIFMLIIIIILFVIIISVFLPSSLSKMRSSQTWILDKRGQN